MSILILTGFGLLITVFTTPDGDGKTKPDRVKEISANCVFRKLNFFCVLTDTWYAVKNLMLYIEGLNKLYYCPVRDNRLADDSCGIRPYRRADSLEWNEEEIRNGKIVKIKGFPKEHKVRLFRAVLSSRRLTA